MKKTGILLRISTAVAGVLRRFQQPDRQFRRRESHRHRFGQRH